MKHILSILLLTATLSSFAQTPPAPPAPPTPPAPPAPAEMPKKERMESMRIAFLTQKLDLTPEEAQKFWPVYNEYQKKKEELHNKRKAETKGLKQNIDSLSDKQIEAIIDGEMAFRQKNVDLEKEYHGKFKSVLPVRKVAKLYKAEEQFKQQLLERLSGKHGKDGKDGKHGKGGKR